ncbi:lipoprotein [Spiroplasma alleghenense]|uniref:Lipoprotein n=1 Tax=Spiroplasma alleghenense TaxID=216931 RepID=A0A345Z2U6_9MOLU|nr:lipoprotein [Spiroplasma alleghenense]AXK50925.1 hypothetical protein SALLE_v1c02490 [Spiroplasma alleghenense]
MKKLLSILAALGIITTSTTGVVSCFEKPVKKMELNTENLDAWVREQKFEYVGEFYLFDDLNEEGNQEWVSLMEVFKDKIRNTIAEAMLKSFEYPEKELIDLYVRVSYSDYKEQINDQNRFKSGHEYKFKFDLDVNYLNSKETLEFKKLEFTFKQTNTLTKRDEISSKSLHYMLSNCDGYENKESNPFSWKYKSGEKELRELIKTGNTEEAKQVIEHKLDYYSTGKNSDKLPYKEIYFTSKVNEFKTREVIDGTDFMKITFTATSTFEKLNNQTEDWESTWII